MTNILENLSLLVKQDLRMLMISLDGAGKKNILSILKLGQIW
jgi:hypothetical protein